MNANNDNEPFGLGEWRVEPASSRLVRGDEIVKIEPRAMRVLQLLASRPGQTISQDEIEATVWTDVVVTPNSVYQSVAQLRRALGDDKSSRRYIETIARKGYRLIAHVQTATPVGTASGDHAEAGELGSPERHTYWRWTRLAALTALPFFISFAIVALRNDVSGHPRQAANSITSSAENSERELEAELLSTGGDTHESPILRAHVLREAARVASFQGRPQEARNHLERAVQLQRTYAGKDARRLGELLTELADVYVWLGEYETAEANARAALDIYKDASKLNPDRIRALHRLGIVAIETGRNADAESYLQEAIGLSTEVWGPDSYTTFGMKESLATLRLSQRRLDEAEQLADGVLAIATQLRADNDYIANLRLLRSNILFEKGSYQRALDEAQAAEALFKKTVRADHPYLASAYDWTGSALLKLGRYQEAEHAFEQAMAIWHKNHIFSMRVGRSMSALGEALLAQGRIGDAEKQLTIASRLLDTGQPGRAERRAIREHARRLEQLRLAKSERKADAAELARL